MRWILICLSLRTSESMMNFINHLKTQIALIQITVDEMLSPGINLLLASISKISKYCSRDSDSA